MPKASEPHTTRSCGAHVNPVTDPPAGTGDTRAPEPASDREPLTSAPFGSVHAWIIGAVADQAAEGFRDDPILKSARKSHALNLLGAATQDNGLMDVAMDSSISYANLAANAPGNSLAAVAVKVALVLRSLGAADAVPTYPDEISRFVLLGQALADLTLLAGRPFALPARACDPMTDEAVAYWQHATAARMA